MRLHLLGVPHTVTRREFSHCAFTGKVLRFSAMMRPLGFDVVHYGVEGSESGATEQVEVMSAAEHRALLGHDYHDPAIPYALDAREGSPLYRQWNLNAREELRARCAPGDLILAPFGHAHAGALRGLSLLRDGVGAVESGIGYRDCLLPWRIYESEAVRHAVMAEEGRAGVVLDRPEIELIAPNYYDPDDWDLGAGGGAFVFAGRLGDAKGIRFLLAIAQLRPDLTFRIAGQGDRAALGTLPPNVEDCGVLGPDERSAYFGSARALLAPSMYVEPFCGTAVEAMLCGTPVIASPFGAFTETVDEYITGYRPPLIVEEWSHALDIVGDLDRALVRAIVKSRYSLRSVGARYAAHFATFGRALARSPYPVEGLRQ